MVKAADYSIALIQEIGLKVKVPTFILSSIFLAIATSFPELFVGIVSAINKEPVLSLGNVLGANLVNLTLIVGLTTIFANGVKVREKMIFKDLLGTFLIALMPYFFLLDGQITRREGLILVLVYLFYQLFLVNGGESFFPMDSKAKMKKVRNLGIQLFSVVTILATSAYLVVIISERLSALVNLPISFIGVFILALGTTLPELIVQFKSSRSREDGIFFGNVLGSIVVNSGLVLGLVCLIHPIEVQFSKSFISLAFFTVLIFILLPIFLRSKNKLERKEGAVLLATYLLFVLTGFFLK